MSDRISDLLDRAPEEGARLVALQLLDAVTLAAKDLRKGKQDALHDFRTTLRRTRSWLKAWTQVMGKDADRFQKELRKVADETGTGRDAEVQLARLQREAKSLKGPDAEAGRQLMKTLEAECHAGYAAARKALAHFSRVQEQLRPALWRYEAEVEPAGAPRRTFAHAGVDVLRTLAEDLSNWLSTVETKDDERALHKSRIRSKRLRYAIEPLREHVPEAEALVHRIKELQDVLGEIHDLHVWRARLTGMLRKKGARPHGIEHLLARAEDQLSEEYGKVQREWLDGGAAALFAEVNALADRLGVPTSPAQAGGPPTEIERKFLLKSLPQAARRGAVKEIWQGFIPGKELHERLRKVTQNGKNTYLRTVKLGRGVKRIEVEEETPKALFEKLWPLTEGHRVLKRRYEVKAGAHTWEVDEFLDRELVLAEIELEREDEQVTIPKWLQPALDREVTGEDEYVNVNLAK